MALYGKIKMLKAFQKKDRIRLTSNRLLIWYKIQVKSGEERN
jgi:hypothetical protein